MDMAKEMKEGMDDKGKYSLSDDEKAQVTSAMEMLKPIAEKKGCSPAELLEGFTGMEEEGEGDDGKLALIVARMKAKNEPDEE